MPTLKSGRYEIPETWTPATNGRWVLGKDTVSGNEVFIKEFLSKRYRPNPENYENIRRGNERTEAYRLLTERINAAVGQIAHNGGDVVVTTDFFREGDSLYKVTEKIPLVPWAPQEVHEHLNVKQVDDMMLRLVNAVSALHMAGLLHCDLKPENVFIVEMDGTYVGMISDFDDSFFIGEVPPHEDVVGTPEYMSPELGAYVTGEEDTPDEYLPLGPASDLFALGLIYHMYLTGEMPSFDYDYYNSQLWSVLFDPDGSYTLSSKLDAPHYTLIQRLLVGDPAYRIKSCMALAGEINKIRTQRNKEYHLLLQNGSKPLSGKQLPLFASYPVGNGDDRQDVTEQVQTIRTDTKGLCILKGIPSDMPLYLECGDELKPVVWKEKNGIYECTMQMMTVINYCLCVLCDNQPLKGASVVLLRQNGSEKQRLAEVKTDAQGRAVYENLPEGNYSAAVDGIVQQVVWDQDYQCVLKMRNYTLQLMRDQMPLAGKKVSLYLCLSSSERKIREGVTDGDGRFVICFPENSKKWKALCDGKEETFAWPAEGTCIWNFPAGVQIVMKAYLSGATTPVEGVMMVIAKKAEKGYQVIAKKKTDIKGQAELGAFDPDEYYAGVVSVPDGYEPKGFRLKQMTKIVVNGAKQRLSLRLDFTRRIVLPDPDQIADEAVIPEFKSKSWEKIVWYQDGRVVLVNRNGNLKKLKNDGQLGLYDLAEYKK